MSKQTAKAKSPSPYDPPSKPTQSGKVPQQGGAASKNKFYVSLGVMGERYCDLGCSHSGRPYCAPAS
jgi:hypothetical protein